MGDGRRGKKREERAVKEKQTARKRERDPSTEKQNETERQRVKEQRDVWEETSRDRVGRQTRGQGFQAVMHAVYGPSLRAPRKSVGLGVGLGDSA